VHLGQALLEVEGHQRQALAEVVRSGCRDCSSRARRGAPERSACQTHSVCGQTCCRCPGSEARYLARACVDGRCAEASDVCTLARRAAPRDPCLP
jgi:hypothetical protein